MALEEYLSLEEWKRDISPVVRSRRSRPTDRDLWSLLESLSRPDFTSTGDWRSQLSRPPGAAEQRNRSHCRGRASLPPERLNEASVRTCFPASPFEAFARRLAFVASTPTETTALSGFPARCSRRAHAARVFAASSESSEARLDVWWEAWIADQAIVHRRRIPAIRNRGLPRSLRAPHAVDNSLPASFGDTRAVSEPCGQARSATQRSATALRGAADSAQDDP